MVPNSVVSVGVSPQFYCQIGSGMPNLCILVEEIVLLSVAMTEKWCAFGLRLKLEHKQ